jgi:hypothetical protein
MGKIILNCDAGTFAIEQIPDRRDTSGNLVFKNGGRWELHKAYFSSHGANGPINNNRKRIPRWKLVRLFDSEAEARIWISENCNE